MRRYLLPWLSCLFLASISLAVNSLASATTLLPVQYDSQRHGFVFGKQAKLDFSADIACGFMRDAGLYASFGLEAQIMRCDKLVLTSDLSLIASENKPT